ncbi:MAG: PD-(D/E)XK nuclease family protein [Candidatus Desulfofervidaceae bacterium]|nr:PD-(D/E)XK nuclease family protein [Candidatus Desulfofervidaceae bacterium]
MHLLAVPFQSDILKIAAQTLLKAHTDLSHIAVIFPTQRSKIYFGQQLAELTGKEALLLPRLYEVSEFLAEATLSPYPGVILNQWQRNLLLKEAIFQVELDISRLFGEEKEAWTEDFLTFASVGKRLLRFYDEIIREGIEFTRLKKHALYTDYEAHIEILEAIWKHYTDLLHKNQFIDPVVKETALLLDVDFLKQFKAVYFVGAITMTHTETAFFQKLDSHVPLTVFFQADKAEGLIPQQNVILKRWGKHKKDIKWIEIPEFFTFNHEIKAFPNTTMQIGLILKGIQEALANGIKPHKIGIILPDEALKNLLLTYINEQNLNLTMGLDVKHTLSYSFLYNLYNLFASETEYGFYYKPFLECLAHPILKARWRQECERWSRRVLENNWLYVKTDVTDNLFSFLRETKERLNVSSFSIFCRTISQLLENWQNHPALKPLFAHYREIRGLNAIWAALEELTTLDKLGIKLAQEPNFLQYFQFVLKHLESLTYPLPARLTNAIQVMGVLETRNLRFDVVIIPDMNEGSFPVYSEKDMFLNTALRQHLGLPTYREREGLYRYYFERLIKGAKRAYLSYVDDPTRGVRSRFLEAMIFREWEEGKDIKAIEESIKNYWPYLQIMTSDISKLSVKTTSNTKGNLPLYKNTHTISRLEQLKFSPTALLTYQICPYKFYLQYVLKIQPPPEVKEHLTPQDKGLALHTVLKEIYKKRLWEKDETEFHQYLCESVMKYFQGLPQFSQPGAKLDIMILQEQLRFFVKNEYRDFQKGWQPEIKWLEQEIEIEFPLVPYSPRVVCLKGIPDRIDRKGRVFRIIDYKTGQAPSPKQCEIGENFKGIQLPFYLFLLHKKFAITYDQCETLAFYDLKESFEIKDNCYLSFKKNPFAYMQEFEAWLKDILSKIFDPTQDWLPKTSLDCNYCPYREMCNWE